MSDAKKPLFIPLMTEHYRAFEDGTKTVEYRKHGKRWNEDVCAVGRAVVISKGYGKYERMMGKIVTYDLKIVEDLPPDVAVAFGRCYPLTTANTLVACIGIELDL